MSDPWILHDPNVPDLPFEDLDRCLEHAREAIRAYLDEDGWTDGVDEIYISRAGLITHRAEKTIIDRSDEMHEERDEDYPEHEELAYDEWWAFSMKEVEPVPE